MSEKHSTVCYIFREAPSPVQRPPFHNDFGLDLFPYKGAVYERQDGPAILSLEAGSGYSFFIGKHGGLEKVQKLIADSLERTGLSPAIHGRMKEKGHLPAKGKG